MTEVEGKRNVGRPGLRWTDVTRNDMIKLGVQEEDAMDRNRWKKITRAADPAILWDKGHMKNIQTYGTAANYIT